MLHPATLGTGPLSFRRYRAAFFSVVGLLATVTAYVWNELRTNARIDELFGRRSSARRSSGGSGWTPRCSRTWSTTTSGRPTTTPGSSPMRPVEETLADARRRGWRYTRASPRV